MTSPYRPDPTRPLPTQMPHPQQGYPGAYPPPGYRAPPAPVAPNKGMGTGKLLLIIGASLIGLCCAGGVAVAAIGGAHRTAKGAGAVPAATGEPATNGVAAAPTIKPAPAKAAHPKLGQPARDGQFEFIVQKVDCGKATVGDEFLNKTAQGQFCLITVDVKNIGKDPRLFDGGNQKATGAGGVKYRNDGVAEFYANKDSKTFLDNINPGNSVTGVLVFDIAKDARISTLELHDSPFSGGVTVDLD
ncbi:MAG: hypothetical protein JWP76_4469 [Dactylosporangium sp.]|jgi:hypothetical protein|nr:hypothetical protein [Dactylosporangium sp.]